jgi:hypothetical protein
MVALACVKILAGEALERLDPAREGAAAEDAALAYLRDNFPAPRRFARVAALSFALVDPYADQLDPERLRGLLDAVQTSAFGQGASRTATLLVLHGEEEEVSRFAKARDRMEIREALDGLPAERRLIQIDAATVLEKTPKMLRFELARPDELTGADLCFSGVFGVKPGRIVGHLVERSVEAIAAGAAEDRFSASHAGDTFDLLKAVAERQSTFPPGYIFAPINFADLMRPGAADAYAAMIAACEGARRQELVFSVYDAPRTLTINACAALKTAFGEGERLVNLVVGDPNFQVEEIPQKAAALVTLNLAATPAPQRSAALQSFRSKDAIYARRGVRQCVSGLRNANEVRLCTEAGFVMLSGPAVAAPARLLRAPVRDVALV